MKNVKLLLCLGILGLIGMTGTGWADSITTENAPTFSDETVSGMVPQGDPKTLIIVFGTNNEPVQPGNPANEPNVEAGQATLDYLLTSSGSQNEGSGDPAQNIVVPANNPSSPPNITAIPEPSTLILLSLGVLGILSLLRRKNNRPAFSCLQ